MLFGDPHGNRQIDGHGLKSASESRKTKAARRSPTEGHMVSQEWHWEQAIKHLVANV
jgi:hypothetical protein